MNTNRPLYDVRPARDFKDMVDHIGVAFADLPAFRIRGKDNNLFDVSFKEFRDTCYALGAVMTEKGWKGETIAVMGLNSYPWITTYLATQMGSGIIVPIDKELFFDDINTILQASEAKVLFLDNAAYKKLEERKSELPRKIKFVFFEEEEDNKSGFSYERMLERGFELVAQNSPHYIKFRDCKIDPDALSVIIFTSGTSGLAKGVMLSQANICFVINSNSSLVKVYPGEDRWLSILPIHHTYECTLGVLQPLYNGGCIAFNDSLLHLMKNLQEIKPTFFTTVPLMLEKIHGRIMQAVSEKKGGKLKLTFGKIIAASTNAMGVNINDRIFEEITKNFGGALRIIIVGAAPVRPDVVKDFKTFGVDTYIGYGMTECAPLICGNHDQLFTIDSVGKPLPGVEVRIDNPDSEGVGEICIKGPNVMLGYYKDEAQTKAVFDEDGWFHSGDLGTIDEEGIVRINGRIKNVIITKNGKNIYPEELEYHLNKNPLIAESMVVGFDDVDCEDTVVEAKIFPDFDAISKKFKEKGKDNPTVEEISKLISDAIKDINKKLPKYKNIKKMSIRENEFIKNTSAKIKRYANMSDEENTINKKDV
ncbi:MAG: long-chain fatty acid--CoA ligase [Ruminococcaceae bacterium]|nr:long-chain fatty acid--CoA ligase [Oscillospiraceae bacterium]